MRMERKLTNSDICPRCNEHPETIIHTLRDCAVTIKVWELILPPHELSVFKHMESESWLKENITSSNFKSKITPGIHWKFVFVSTIWQVWKTRNNWVFQNCKVPERTTVNLVKRLTLELHNTFTQKKVTEKEMNLTVKWRRPERGWAKINTDGSVVRATKKAAIGGLIRDEEGNWITGFAKSIGDVSVTGAELLAAREGLSGAWERRLPKIILEVDSETTVKLIKSAKTELHPFGSIIEDCRQLLGMPWESILIHVRRSGNKCADALATKGHVMGNRTIWFEEPPEGLTNLMKEDLV